MKTVIIAPHPDDEWIGCGCTLLKKIDGCQKISVLIITRLPRTERRIQASRILAKQYKYGIKILGMPELGIDAAHLSQFLRNNIQRGDIVYIPSIDKHPDHCKIHRIARQALGNNPLFEYAVYNNSRNPFLQLKNKILGSFLHAGFPSFRFGDPGKKFIYHAELKSRIIVDYFRETPRRADLLRELK